jgi:hypothetical protein
VSDAAPPDRVWVRLNERDSLVVSITKPPEPAIEYMRVLSRAEVEKLASYEGVDLRQLLNSLHRTIDGQKKHIARLEATCQQYADAMEEDGNV